MRLIFLLFFVVCPLSLQAAEEDFARSVREVLSDDSYQKELPCITDRETNKACGPREINVETPGWIKAIGEFFKFLKPLGPVLFYLFWGAIILIVGYLLYYLVTGFEWRGGRLWKKKKREKPRPAPTRVVERPAEARVPTLSEADALAREGDFSAAVHFLLLAGIDLLQRKLRGMLAASETSRELLGHAAIPEQQKQHLQPLIRYVEISMFAGRGLTRDEYDLCRENFLALQNIQGGRS